MRSNTTSTMNFTNGTQLVNVTQSLPQLNQMLSLTGGIVGFILSIAGQRLSRAGHLVMTVASYLLLPRIIKINVCCTKQGSRWVHAGLAALLGIFGGLATIPRRAIGNFMTSACSGALLGMLTITFIPQWNSLFHGHTALLMSIFIPASLTGALSQTCNQNIQLIPATATCGSYAVIIAIDTFARISEGFSWILKDLHLRANQVMYGDPYTRPNSKETTLQSVDYILFTWWFVESLMAAVIQLCVTTSYMREWIKRRREPPP
ncbi:uncharacterized protein LOC134178315 isoform X2 [Corticium candelabrum]|uniref:uncharacterized protein LOC134178315 isoform X2 n=1 Tax=Corticium candelabrum TaxID=121492 RepID=UPI002E2771A1|nr:uncharacterized protein LOC134178315 isoform X2 [Corticium candelabrum]